MKLAKVAVSTELMMQIMTQGWNTQSTACESGIPEGSELAYSHIDDDNGMLYFVIQHESFEDLRPGDMIPQLPRPTFRKWYYPEVEELLNRLKQEQSA